MSQKVTVVVMRHPEKKGDAITSKGSMQAFAAAQNFISLGYIFERLYNSGAHRTRQTSEVVRAALGQFQLTPATHKGFHFQEAFDKSYPDGNTQAFIDELAEIKKAGAVTVEQCFVAGIGNERFKNYFIACEKNLSNAVKEIAAEMASIGQTTALAVSHSPLTELAVLMGNEMPCGLGEADAVAYEITMCGDDAEITGFGLIKAPMEGQANV